MSRARARRRAHRRCRRASAWWPSAFLRDAVRARQELHWVHRLAAGGVADAAVRQVTVADDERRVLLLDRLLQSLDHPLLELLVLGPVAPHAVDARALVGDLDSRAGELHEVTALQADVLRL